MIQIFRIEQKLLQVKKDAGTQTMHKHTVTTEVGRNDCFFIKNEKKEENLLYSSNKENLHCLILAF